RRREGTRLDGGGVVVAGGGPDPNPLPGPEPHLAEPGPRLGRRLPPGLLAEPPPRRLPGGPPRLAQALDHRAGTVALSRPGRPSRMGDEDLEGLAETVGEDAG